MADFKKAFITVLKHEGGYVFDPDDPGGETYKGVSRANHSKWEGWFKIDELKTKKNFPKNLDDDQDLHDMISKFYEVKFWDRMRCDDIIDQDIAESIFDFGVNAGPGTSIRLAQAAIGVKVDGAIGPNTLKALNGHEKDFFLSKFINVKLARYIHLIKKNPKLKKYLFGWLRRTLGDV